MNILPFQVVKDKIVVIGELPVILDFNVAELYGVKTKEVNQAVKNNPEKFPEGYVFELDNKQIADLRSKNLTANLQKSRSSKGIHRKRALYACDHIERKRCDRYNNINYRSLRQTAGTLAHDWRTICKSGSIRTALTHAEKRRNHGRPFWRRYAYQRNRDRNRVELRCPEAQTHNKTQREIRNYLSTGRFFIRFISSLAERFLLFREK